MIKVNFIPRQPGSWQIAKARLLGQIFKGNKRLMVASVSALAVFGLGLTAVVSQSSGPILFGVQDSGGSDSQFFNLDMGANLFTDVGPEHENHDIEAMDFHPLTCDLYAIAGGGGNQDGKFFTVDTETGLLTLLGATGATGSKEIVAASFHPAGVLWAAQENVGLVTVNLSTGGLSLQLSYTSETGDDWEGLAWDNAGSFLYGVEDKKLFRVDPTDMLVEQVCANLPKPTEALEFTPDGTLMGGQHKGSQFNLYSIAIDTCGISSVDHSVPYNDIESITFDVCADDEEPPVDECANNLDPVADLVPLNATITLGEDVTYTNTTVDPEGLPLELQWLVDGSAVSGETGETFNFEPGQTGMHTIGIEVFDSCGNWDSAETNLTVEEPPTCELTIEKIGQPEEVFPGDEIIYSVRVENIGAGVCEGVILTENYDSNTTFVSAEPEPTSGDNTWELGTLEPNQETMIIITVALTDSAAAGDIIVNEACVEETTKAPCATAETLVKAKPEPNQCELNSLPQPVISPVKPTIVPGESINFSAASSTDADLDELTFAWMIEDLSLSAAAETFEVTLDSTGDFTILLTASDQCGGDSVVTTLRVVAEPDEEEPDEESDQGSEKPLVSTIFGGEPADDESPPEESPSGPLPIFGGEPPPGGGGATGGTPPSGSPLPPIFGGSPTPPSVSQPLAEIPPTVLGETDNDFETPSISPRAGSPISAVGVGLAGGFFTGAGTFIASAMRRRRPSREARRAAYTEKTRREMRTMMW